MIPKLKKGVQLLVSTWILLLLKIYLFQEMSLKGLMELLFIILDLIA